MTPHWLRRFSNLASTYVIRGMAVATVSVGLAAAQAQTTVQQLQVLYTFTGGTDGGNPEAGLIRDSAGNLYGTTYAGGGDCSCGVVFRVSKTGVESVLYAFSGDPDFGGPDGGFPMGSLTSDRSGNLYGATTAGGDPFFGVVFRLDREGRYSVLHRFVGSDGSFPLGLTHDAGNLYGVTLQAKEGNCCGAVYRVDSIGKETPLAFFSGFDGSDPYGDLVLDAKGNLYGTTASGGASVLGVVFKLDKIGNLKVLHSFAGGATDGANPYSGLLADGSGNAYGTTYSGGSSDKGVVYRIDQTGEVTVLYSFTGGADGGNPLGGLVRDSDSNLYGTTLKGGIGCSGPQPGCGVVFKLDKTGEESVLHAFSGGADGAGPEYEKLVRDNSGNLYGTTAGGGAGYGVVFAIIQ
jgi:uncharacterized repeat protein (TIGR03803 family)